MTVSRSALLLVSLSLVIALCGFPLLAQTPAVPEAAEPAEKPVEQPDKPKKPDKTEKKKSPRPSDDDDDRPKPARARKVIERPAPMPIATPIPKKRGWLKSIFSSRPPATPMPVRSTPRPTPRPKKPDDDNDPPKRKTLVKVTPHVDSDDPGEISKPNTPPHGKKNPPKGLEKMEGGDMVKLEQALTSAKKGGDADAIEQATYDLTRTRALADDHVRELKAKADAALSDDESRQTYRAFLTALYEKMRKLEPSITEYVDLMEKATRKRIGGTE